MEPVKNGAPFLNGLKRNGFHWGLFRSTLYMELEMGNWSYNLHNIPFKLVETLIPILLVNFEQKQPNHLGVLENPIGSMGLVYLPTVG